MEKLDFFIRPANISDVKNIHHILSEAFKPYKEFYTKEAYNVTVISTDKIIKRIKNPDFYVIVALIEDKIVGTTTIYIKNHNHMHIITMAVDPKYQKKGIGYNLLSYIHNIAREKKFQQISLESYKPLKKAIALYEK